MFFIIEQWKRDLPADHADPAGWWEYERAPALWVARNRLSLMLARGEAERGRWRIIAARPLDAVNAEYA